MKCVIYYFTGTGNNLAIAKQLAKELGNTTILPMKELLKQKEIPAAYDWVGFTAPSYFSHVPPFVEQCMDGVIYTEKQKIFLIAGCGGNRGLSIQDMRKKVIESGKVTSLEYMVTLSGSYILSYNAFPKWYNDFVRKMSYKKITKIANEMRENKSRKPLGKGIFYQEKYEERIQQSIKGMSKVCEKYTVDSNCTGCEICTKVCPVGNIVMKDGKPVFGDSCNQCMACIQWCPAKAIDCEQKAKNRTRYHHKDISVRDITEQKKADKEKNE